MVQYFTSLDFKNKIGMVKNTNSEYLEVIKKYHHYDGSNLITRTLDLINQTDKLIADGWNITYSGAEYKAFKRRFMNMRNSYKQQNFLRSVKNQVNGETWEKRVQDALQAASGLKVLHNVQLPCTYLNRYGQKYSGSNQMDIVLVCQYGVFSFEVKNYFAHQLQIVNSSENINVWDEAKKKIINLPNQAIKVTYSNGKSCVYASGNSIGEQTYNHRQALIKNLAADPYRNFNAFSLNFRVDSAFVYANQGIKNDFYLGNQANIDSTFKVTGLSIDECWEWVKSHPNDNLGLSDVDEFNQYLEEMDRQTREKKYIHSILLPDQNGEEILNLKKVSRYLQFLNKWQRSNENLG